jgi:hypothetical protein
MHLQYRNPGDHHTSLCCPVQAAAESNTSYAPRNRFTRQTLSSADISIDTAYSVHCMLIRKVR